MTKFSKITNTIIAGGGVLILSSMVNSLVVSKGRTVFPIHVSIRNEFVPAPETRVWVSALEHRLSPAEFEEVVKTHSEGRDYALGLFAYNGMTNHVRILLKYGADASDRAMEALNFSGMTNAVSLIQSVAPDMNQSMSNNCAARINR